MTKILIIEDEDMLRGEVSEWLAFEGYEVFSAKDGVAGLECAFRDLPDLIVCDIMMPRLDGYGVLLEMRSNPGTAAIPFIFMTAKVTTEDIRRGMVLGADDYLTKPFERLDLLQAIQTRLAKKAMLEQNHQHDVEQLQTALEQEIEHRLLKAQIVAMFSHDFRNPLAGIMSSISLVRDYADRMDAQRRLVHLNRAEASVRQLIQMLDDMLVVSQMETGNLDFKPEQLNIEDFIQRMVEEFQTLHRETHPLIFESRFNDTTMADPRLLRQIATNLVSNAIKYSPPGSEVRVTLDHDGSQYILTVKDHGIGIPEADQSRLFAAFQRGSNVKDRSGTGLGLTIVQQAVDLLGGSVHLESQVGAGTTITVHIPMTAGGG
jgi:two-component system, sensor histidine kinase and response regulator